MIIKYNKVGKADNLAANTAKGTDVQLLVYDMEISTKQNEIKKIIFWDKSYKLVKVLTAALKIGGDTTEVLSAIKVDGSNVLTFKDADKAVDGNLVITVLLGN